MADKKISELDALTGAAVATDDQLIIVDTSAGLTKNITIDEFKNALDTATGFVRITGDTMTGDLDVQGTVTADGLTVGSSTLAESASDLIIDAADDLFLRANGQDAIRIFQDAGSLQNVGFRNTAQNGSTFLVSGTGDISFYEDTGTTAKFFWDASAEKARFGGTDDDFAGSIGLSGQTFTIEGYLNNSLVLNAKPNASNEGVILQYNGTDGLILNNAGNVGIGTSSPSVKLHVNSGTGDSAAIFESSDATCRIIIKDSTAVSGGSYLADVGDTLTVSTAGTERMRIDADGNVGIGTSSPSNKLSVSDATNAFIAVTNTTAAKTSYIGTTTAGDFEVNAAAASANAVFKTVGSEAMRIDASGNLLVGTTDSNPVANNVSSGVQFGDGRIRASRADRTVLELNRKTSDGSIAEFRKDGTTVGSIGNRATQIYIETPTKTGLDFAGDILPRYNGSLDNGVNVDLGSSGYRFKDLYLSGGVYLGGTGSANKLDDYETGTWTPVAFNGTTTTYGTRLGRYVKIGDLVFIHGRLTLTSIGDGSTTRIGGLPFANNQEDTMSISKLTNAAVNFYSFSLRTAGSTLYGSIQSGLDGNLTTNVAFLGDTTEIQFSGTYQAS